MHWFANVSASAFRPFIGQESAVLGQSLANSRLCFLYLSRGLTHVNGQTLTKVKEKLMHANWQVKIGI